MPSERPSPARVRGRGEPLLAALLGVNLWVSALFVPTVAARAWAIAPLLLPAPVLLVFGLVSGSAPALLLGVPLAALLPLGLPELAGPRQQPGPFVVAALALAAYLVVVLRHLARRDLPSLAGVARPLPERSGLSLRWLRRRFLYRGFVVAAALVPAAIVWSIDLAPSVTDTLRAHNEQPESARALLTAAGAFIAIVIFAHALVRPLVGHLELDAPVHAELDRRQRRPWSFWITLAFGAGLAAAALARRHLLP